MAKRRDHKAERKRRVGLFTISLSAGHLRMLDKCCRWIGESRDMEALEDYLEHTTVNRSSVIRQAIECLYLRLLEERSSAKIKQDGKPKPSPNGRK